MDQDGILHGGRPRPRRLCVRWGPSPLPKQGADLGGGATQFSAHVYCGETAGWIKMALGGRPWSRPHCARWGPSSSPKKGQSPPQFSAHLYCGQTAEYIKMPLGIEVGLSCSPAQSTLCYMETQPLPQKDRSPPIFCPRLLWPNGCMDQDATLLVWMQASAYATLCSMWTQLPQKKGTHPTQFLADVYCGQTARWMKTPLGTEVDLDPGHIVLDGVPAPAKGAQQPPSFRLMSIVAKDHGRPYQLLLSSCILNGPTVWSQYTNVTLGLQTGQTAGQDRQTDRTDNIA